jgi:hypothetical protein
VVLSFDQVHAHFRDQLLIRQSLCIILGMSPHHIHPMRHLPLSPDLGTHASYDQSHSR